jgi:hypothetical protein
MHIRCSGSQCSDRVWRCRFHVLITFVCQWLCAELAYAAIIAPNICSMRFDWAVGSAASYARVATARAICSDICNIKIVCYLLASSRRESTSFNSLSTWLCIGRGRSQGRLALPFFGPPNHPSQQLCSPCILAFTCVFKLSTFSFDLFGLF